VAGVIVAALEAIAVVSAATGVTVAAIEGVTEAEIVEAVRVGSCRD
tara:strand:+ start:202 stop:339 length:138 start_codon:yes stop_codon:yes gene_type:complete